MDTQKKIILARSRLLLIKKKTLLPCLEQFATLFPADHLQLHAGVDGQCSVRMPTITHTRMVNTNRCPALIFKNSIVLNKRTFKIATQVMSVKLLGTLERQILTFISRRFEVTINVCELIQSFRTNFQTLHQQINVMNARWLNYTKTLKL
jgi:hypothetical protein